MWHFGDDVFVLKVKLSHAPVTCSEKRVCHPGTWISCSKEDDNEGQKFTGAAAVARTATQVLYRCILCHTANADAIQPDSGAIQVLHMCHTGAYTCHAGGEVLSGMMHHLHQMHLDAENHFK